ncbi:MAG: radical SAM protein [Bacteroidales bacterium]|nr:radical SAM protein [Bacteroidales bacterium]
MKKTLKKTVKSLIHVSLNVVKCLEYNIASLLNLNIYPKFLVFYTTFRCNSRCKACNIWKGNDKLKQEKELSIEQISTIFSDPLFKKIQNINIQGGEATLREDLVELVSVIISKMPSLKQIGLTSNGLNTKLVVTKAKRLYELCHQNGIHFSLGFSIDGVGKYHDFARGIDAFKKVSKSIEEIKELKKMPDFSLVTNCVLTACNICNINEIVEFQRQTFNMTSPNLTVVEFREHFLNVKNSPEGQLLLFTENPKEKKLLVSYLKQHNIPHSFSDYMTFRYEQLRAMLEDNKPRTQSCQYKISGLVLDHQGNIMICPIGGRIGSCLNCSPSKIFFSFKTKLRRKQLIKTACRNCFPYNFYTNERQKDFLKYIVFFLRALITKKRK